MIATLLILCLLSSPWLVAQAPPATEIRWHLPGRFGEAKADAVKRQRILLIKGISFGVDEAGALRATRGRW